MKSLERMLLVIGKVSEKVNEAGSVGFYWVKSTWSAIPRHGAYLENIIVV